LVPRRPREEPLLPDRIKRVLNEQGAMLPVSVDRASMELERRERVRRAARESLTISWPATAEDGSTQLPSFYLDDLGIAQTDRVARTVGDTTWQLGLAANRAERLTRATMVARHRSAETVGAELDLVRSALTSISSAEHRAYAGLLHAGQVIQLPTDILAECTPMAGIMSASQAKQVASCLYQHFGNKRLGLRTLAAPRLDQLRLGTIAHRVLDEIGRAGFDGMQLEATFDKWWAKEVPAAEIDTPEAVFNREILLANLAVLVEQEREHLALSGSRAELFELAFGLNDEGRDPLSLAAGLEVQLPAGSSLASSTLRGSIDRVDVVERDGKRYGVAIDYKLGRGASNWEEMKELADFQLAIYCEVLPMFGIEPVGAVYLGVANQQRYGLVRSDFASHFIREGETGKVETPEPAEFAGFMRASGEALRIEIARLARGGLKVKHRNDDCKFCDLRPVCRIGTFGAGGVVEE
jgi:ATP-dependent helicase/DNAse subunit B